MNIKNIYLVMVLSIGVILNLDGQCAPNGTQNISVTGATITPNPLPALEDNGSGQACFTFDATQGVSLCPNEEIEVRVCFNKLSFSGPPTEIPSLFNSWEVDPFAPNCYVGTISNNLSILSGTRICFDVDVTENTDATDPPSAQNNMSVNLIPHNGDPSQGDSDDDTFVSTYTDEALPIQLVSFNAEKIDHKSLLTWVTASEEENEFFEVLRSRDIETWSIIGKVPGAGTTHLRQDYSLIDNYPLQGVNYYQLRQVDFNGEDSFSPIVKVEFGEVPGEDIKMFPNPVTQQLQLYHIEGRGISRVQITDMKGAVLRNEILKGNTLDFSDYNSGLYIVQLFTGDGNLVHTEKVLRTNE